MRRGSAHSPAHRPAGAPRLADTGLRRRWRVILPVIFITYSLAYLDRANYSFAAASTLRDDLRLSDATTSLLGAAFFFGYFVLQLPAAHIVKRFGVKRLVTASLIAWGLLASAAACIDHAGPLLVTRFLLGAVEAVVMPALLIYISRWFSQTERSRANTFLILGNPVTIMWMSVLSGYLIAQFGWRAMFVVEGVPAVLWALVWWRYCDERPADAAWLGDDEREHLIQLLETEQKALSARLHTRSTFHTRIDIAAPRAQKTTLVLFSTLYFCWSVGVYGFVLWLPSILKEAASMGMVATGWWSALPYFFATMAMLTIAWISDRTARRLSVVWPCLLVSAAALFASYASNAHSLLWSYGLLLIAGAAMYAPYGPFFAAVTERLPQALAANALAIINAMGALGSFIGSYVVGYLNGATKMPALSFAFMAAALLVAGLLTLALARDEPRYARAGA